MKSGQALITIAICLSTIQAIAFIAEQNEHNRKQVYHNQADKYDNNRQNRERSDNDSCTDNNKSNSDKKSRSDKQKWKQLKVNFEVQKRRQSRSDKQPKNLVDYQGGKKGLDYKIPVKVIGKQGAPIVHPLIIEKIPAPARKHYHHQAAKYNRSCSDDNSSKTDKKYNNKKRTIIVGDAQ